MKGVDCGDKVTSYVFYVVAPYYTQDHLIRQPMIITAVWGVF